VEIHFFRGDVAETLGRHGKAYDRFVGDEFGFSFETELVELFAVFEYFFKKLFRFGRSLVIHEAAVEAAEAWDVEFAAGFGDVGIPVAFARLMALHDKTFVFTVIENGSKAFEGKAIAVDGEDLVGVGSLERV